MMNVKSLAIFQVLVADRADALLPLDKLSATIPCHLRFGSEDVSHVLASSKGLSKLIPIDEETNHQIVHLFRLKKQIVRRTKRLIRVRRLVCLLSIFWVFSLPTWCFSASRCRS